MGGCGCGCLENLYLYYGGGSGGGFIGTVKLTRGVYTVHVGAGQNYKRSVTDSSPVTDYFSIPDSSYINGVVTCAGADRITAGTAPILSTTALSTTLNTQGNDGGNDGTFVGDFSQAVTTGMIVGASVYNGYGVGSGESPFYMLYGTDEQPTHAGNGYIKIVYKGR